MRSSLFERRFYQILVILELSKVIDPSLNGTAKKKRVRGARNRTAERCCCVCAVDDDVSGITDGC